MLDIHNILCVCVCERENAIVCNGFLCVWHLGIILPTASAVLFGVLQSAHSEQQALGMLYELWSILLSCVCGGCVEGVCGGGCLFQTVPCLDLLKKGVSFPSTLLNIIQLSAVSKAVYLRYWHPPAQLYWTPHPFLLELSPWWLVLDRSRRDRTSAAGSRQQEGDTQTIYSLTLFIQSGIQRGGFEAAISCSTAELCLSLSANSRSSLWSLGPRAAQPWLVPAPVFQL